MAGTQHPSLREPGRRTLIIAYWFLAIAVGGQAKLGGARPVSPLGWGCLGLMSTFPKAPHFSCFQSHPWKGWHRSQIEASSLGRRGPRGAQDVHPFIQAFVKYLLYTKLALGSAVGHTCAIQPGMGVQAESSRKAIVLLQYLNTPTLDGK